MLLRLIARLAGAIYEIAIDDQYERTSPPREISRPVARAAWDGSPDNLLVEDPHTSVWTPYASWMDEHFEIRLDPFMCDPDPVDLAEYELPQTVRDV